ncbi:hypothetical protein BUALT_Bualt18G0051600 [Buddleja alternifolia]|uniref:RING-type E3 ubiquitin transferase n=1 Tax=Buddleja alternifolia TaxID=168488 RepID=A0AAV6W8T6_9LAMI|nr:hypothetical protein BUALT_Bualt18G0051600 [Buddleja alternifolia]
MPGRSFYQTNVNGVYKIEAVLYFRSHYRYYREARTNNSYDGLYRHQSTPRGPGTIRFSLDGFWSDISRKLCMVGSTSWQVDSGRSVNLDAVLKLNYGSDHHHNYNQTIYNSVISGSLESVSSVNDVTYFDPVLIFSFPDFSYYTYSLVSNDGFYGGLKDGFLGLERRSFCRLLSWRTTIMELESAVNGSLPRFVYLNPIQCSTDKKKLRYIVKFQNMSYVYEDFRIDSTFVGEASWDDDHNQLNVVACRILSPVNHLGHAVGDCTMRLSLRYTSIWTIRDDAKIVGQIWTIDDSKKINLTSYGGSSVIDFPGLRYEYTELDKSKRSCLAKKNVKKGEIYPDGHSYDMKFDMSVKNSKGEQFAWGYAIPLFVGNELYEMNNRIIAVNSVGPVSDTGFTVISEPERSAVPLNISYKVSINPFPQTKFSNSFSTLNLSRNIQGQIEINAEGVYRSETGQLCMVGCRNLHNSTDCEILVNFDFSPLNKKRGNFSLTKGTIRSTRTKKDPLFFDNLSLTSAAFSTNVAKQSIWRMDSEIAMVLISNMLSCVFIALQIFHGKRNPETFACISLVMLVILSLGHMIPLVLNFEVLLLRNRGKQALMLNTGGWIEANEVTIRVVTMVAFLLQIRLLQLVWTSKTSEGNENRSWVGEKKAAFVSFPLYILGGLGALLLNWMRKYSLWGNLWSYGGLVLDGFLVPQILLNIFRGSAEKALSHSFYIGTSAIRVVPHAYDQYRAHNYPTFHVNGTYYYADHNADFYSTAWDVVIPLGVIALAVIIFLQQRRGGRWIVPQRFRELELYEKVPTVNNE